MIHDERNFIIRDGKLFFHDLRFINSDNVKQNSSIEFSLLKLSIRNILLPKTTQINFQSTFCIVNLESVLFCGFFFLNFQLENLIACLLVDEHVT